MGFAPQERHRQAARAALYARPPVFVTAVYVRPCFAAATTRVCALCICTRGNSVATATAWEARPNATRLSHTRHRVAPVAWGLCRSAPRSPVHLDATKCAAVAPATAVDWHARQGVGPLDLRWLRAREPRHERRDVVMVARWFTKIGSSGPQRSVGENDHAYGHMTNAPAVFACRGCNLNR